MCKVYIGYHGTSEIEHGLCACTVDNPLACKVYIGYHGTSEIEHGLCACTVDTLRTGA